VRIRLARDLFLGPVEHLLLVALFRYAFEDRHRIDISLAEPEVTTWIQGQTQGLREELELTVAASAEAEALTPSGTTVVVGRFQASDYSADPITLRLGDARTFLERPIVLLLEDAKNDQEFLLTMLTAEERKVVQRYLDRGFLRVDHGGGLENMLHRVVDAARDRQRTDRLWVLFDSDALQPGQPSASSERLRIACAAVPHYQLRRRFIESYLTPQALHGWATTPNRKSERDRRLTILREFLKLRKEQRHHFNMKGGFEGDARRTDASAGTLYDDVADPTRRALRHGFGPEIRRLFATHVTERDLREDSGWSELRPAIQVLLAQLR
jgi:hypothetical protein